MVEYLEQRYFNKTFFPTFKRDFFLSNLKFSNSTQRGWALICFEMRCITKRLNELRHYTTSYATRPVTPLHNRPLTPLQKNTSYAIKLN